MRLFPYHLRLAAKSLRRDLGMSVVMLIALAVGTGFSFAALSARDDANRSAATYPDYSSRWSTAQGRSHIAIGAFAAGAALTGAALYRYWHVRRAHAPPSPKLEAWAGPVTATAAGAGASGAIAGVGGRF